MLLRYSRIGLIEVTTKRGSVGSTLGSRSARKARLAET
jgi:hypothetical protein